MEPLASEASPVVKTCQAALFLQCCVVLSYTFLKERREKATTVWQECYSFAAATAEHSLSGASVVLKRDKKVTVGQCQKAVGAGRDY